MKWVGGVAGVMLSAMLALGGAAAQERSGFRQLGQWVLASAAEAGVEGLAPGDDGGVVAAGHDGGRPRVVHFDGAFRIADDWVLPGSDARPRAVAALPGAVVVVAGPAEPPEFEHGMAVWRLVLGEDGHLHQDWLRRFRRTALDGGTGVTALPDGGVVVAGWSGGAPGATDAGWIIRLGPDGDSAWRRLALPFTDGGVFEARAAARTVAGDVLVAARGAAGPDKPGGVWLLRFDLDGNDYAQKVIEEVADVHPAALAALSDGSAIAGRVSPPGEPWRSRAWLVRCDKNGDILWDRHWGDDGRNGLEAVASLPDGGVLVAGWLDNGHGNPEAWLARLDDHGQSLWERRFPGRGAFRTLTVLADGTAVAAGGRGAAGHERMWLVRFGF